MAYDHTVFNVTQAGEVQIVRDAAHPERVPGITALLDLLVKKKKEIFIDKKIIVISGDFPQPPNDFNEFNLKFSTVVPLHGESPYHRFPTSCTLSWSYFNMPDVQGMLHNMLDDNRDYLDKRIFWAGHPHHSQRRDYATYSEQHTDICNTILINNGNNNNDEWRHRFISIPDHANYKYLMDIQGQGWSGRLKFLLATGRVVFIPDRPWVEHWHRDLIPWQHYVPVNEDFSDLEENYYRLESNQELYNTIAQNAKQFTRDNILLESQLTRIINTL